MTDKKSNDFESEDYDTPMQQQKKTSDQPYNIQMDFQKKYPKDEENQNSSLENSKDSDQDADDGTDNTSKDIKPTSKGKFFVL